MKHEDRNQFEEDIDQLRAHQGPTVFPHTLTAGRTVDSFLWKGTATPTLVQRIGMLLLGVPIFAIGVGFLLLTVSARSDYFLRAVTAAIGIPMTYAGARVCRNTLRRSKL